MESVTIIFSMFRLVFVEILSYGVRYALIIAKMRVVSSPLWMQVVTRVGFFLISQIVKLTSAEPKSQFL